MNSLVVEDSVSRSGSKSVTLRSRIRQKCCTLFREISDMKVTAMASIHFAINPLRLLDVPDESLKPDVEPASQA